MFIERDDKPDGAPTYIISYENLVDIGDQSVLIDNLRAMAAGETEAVPRFYAAKPGSSALYRMDVETEEIEGEPGRRLTKVFNTSSGDMMEEMRWYIEGAGEPGRAEKTDEPEILYLLAESHPLPGSERRLVPIGGFKKKAKARKWAQERLEQIEHSADGDGITGIEFSWPPATGGLPGEEKCLVWEPPHYIANSPKYAPPGSTPFVIIPIPAKPKMTGGYREWWAERIAVLEQQDAPAKEIAEAEKNLGYARKWDS